jgi:hypothetical protein
MVLCSAFFGFKVLNIGIFVYSEYVELKSSFVCGYFDGVQVHHFSTLSMHSVHLCIPPTMCVVLLHYFQKLHVNCGLKCCRIHEVGLFDVHANLEHVI